LEPLSGASLNETKYAQAKACTTGSFHSFPSTDSLLSREHNRMLSMAEKRRPG